MYTYRGRGERGRSCDSRPPTVPCLDRDGPLRRRLANAILPTEPIRPNSSEIDNPCMYICDCGQNNKLSLESRKCESPATTTPNKTMGNIK